MRKHHLMAEVHFVDPMAMNRTLPQGALADSGAGQRGGIVSPRPTGHRRFRQHDSQRGCTAQATLA